VVNHPSWFCLMVSCGAQFGTSCVMLTSRVLRYTARLRHGDLESSGAVI
jgi:hypothetical protein